MNARAATVNIALALLIVLPMSISASTSHPDEIIVREAHAIYTYAVTSVPADLLSCASSVASRVIVQSANAGYILDPIYPRELIGDGIAPVITGITTIPDSDHSDLAWSTDELAACVVSYGIQSGVYSHQVDQPLFVSNHQVTLTGLAQDTIYYYRITCADRSGNQAVSAEQRFRLPGPTPPPTGTTTRVSVASDGSQGNDNSWLAAISADGRYVAFMSDASNLVSGDSNNARDIFLRDRQSSQTTRISVSSSGSQGNDHSFYPVISSDGRYVAFESRASNLVSGDTNSKSDVFVHDRQTGQTTRVSVASDGSQGNSDSSRPAISADGRYVVFLSDASNLVAGDTNGAQDVFVHDRQMGQTTRVSIASDGSQGNGHSSATAVSADGRYVAFTSIASNLVSGDTNGKWDVFLHDRQTSQTTRISVTSDGSQGYDSSFYPAISTDGRYAAFGSYANNLVNGDTNNDPDVFVHDRITSQTIRVSVASDGSQASASGKSLLSISDGGRYVAFGSLANNLVSGDTNDKVDVFVHDRQTGQTSRVSITSDESQGNSDSSDPLLSADGRYIAFASLANNLVSGDTNGVYDIFVRDREDGTTRYSISGRATDGSGNPISEVTVSNGAGRTATTDASGNYTFSDLAAGTYTVTPSKSGYTFSPASRTVSVPPSATGQDFTATTATPYSISGRVTDGSSNPISGVVISNGAGHTATTDASGNYTISGLSAGTYTLTPSKSGCTTFSPTSRTVSVPPSATGQNFATTCGTTSTRVKIIPATKHTYLSGTFTITLTVENVTNLAAFQTELAYTPSIVNATAVTLGAFLSSTGRTVSPVGPTIDNTTGKVTFGAFSFGSQPGASGSGALATIAFQPRAVGTTTLHLQNLGLADPNSNPITATTEDGQVQISNCFGDFDGDNDVDIFDLQQAASKWNCRSGDTCYDAQFDADLDGDIDVFDLQRFAAAWGTVCTTAQALQSPDIAGLPQEATAVSIGLIPASVRVTPGDLFTQTVRIQDAANVGAFQTDLVYDPAVVRVEGVTIGSFLGSTGRTVTPLGPAIDNSKGRVTFGAFTFGAQPGASEAGDLAYVRLLAQTIGQTALDFQQTAVSDPQGDPAPIGALSGGVVIVRSQHQVYLPTISKSR